MDYQPGGEARFAPLSAWIRASHQGPPATANTTTATSSAELLPIREEFLANSLSPCSFLADPSSTLWVAPDEVCAICYGLLHHAVKLPCNHFYCRECISTWLASNNTCPMDRRVLFRVTPAPMSPAEEVDVMLDAEETRFTSRLWFIRGDYSRKLELLQDPILESMDDETRTLNQLSSELSALRWSQMAEIPPMRIWDWQRLTLENDVADSRQRLRGHLQALELLSSPGSQIWKEAAAQVLEAKADYLHACHVVVHHLAFQSEDEGDDPLDRHFDMEF